MRGHLLALTLAGASCRAPYREAPLDPEQVASEFVEAALELPTSGERADWVALALRHRREPLVAAAEAEEARAALRTASTRPNPTLEFVPELVPGASRPWILAWTLSLPLDLDGTRARTREVAERLLDARALAVPRAAWEVRCEVVAALDGLASARERGALADEHLRLMRERVDWIGRLVAAGARPATDATAAELERTRAELERRSVAAELEAAHVELARALGIPRASLGEPLVLPPRAELSAPPEDARQKALVDRPDLAALLAEYAVAEAELRRACARRFPGLSLGPGWSYDQGDHKLALGLTLELPIVDRNEGPIAEAEARRKTVAERFRAREEQALGEIEGARTRYELARETLAEAERAVALALRARDESEQRLRAGLTDRGRLLDDELVAVTLHAAQVEARDEAARAALALERAQARPLEGEA